MISETKKTSDYKMFKKHPSNREIDESNLKRIMASIKANNLLEYKPLMVDAELRVIDGQHRLEAAKQLGLPIYYQIKDDACDEDIVLLCDAQKDWNVDDYCHFYEAKGNLTYLTIRELSKKSGYSVSLVINSLLTSDGYGSPRLFKQGKAPALSKEKIDEFLQLCEKIKRVNEAMDRFCFARRIKYLSPGYLRALRALFSFDGFDLDVFLKKIASKAEIIRSCSTSFAYLQLFRDVYNYRNNNPIE